MSFLSSFPLLQGRTPASCLRSLFMLHFSCQMLLDALGLFLSLILTAVIGGGNTSSTLHMWNVRLMVCKWWSHCSEAVRVALVLPPLLNPPRPFNPPNSMKQAQTEDSAKRDLAHREVMVCGPLVLMGFTSRGKQRAVNG